MSTPGLKLFDRLPDGIFGPLASPNRRMHWKLFCQLYDRRFGPYAPLPPANGIPRSEIIDEVERDLQIEDVGLEELPETPLNVRAHTIFNIFKEAGWFRVDRVGVRDTVSIRPVVAHFMDRMVDFAEHGPVFLSGKVRSIEANLMTVMSGEGSGDTLEETAAQARHLMEYVRNTGTNVRDIMEIVSQQDTVRGYVARFFTDFIENVFIADYGELRTRDHPLSRRPQILRMVEQLRQSPEQTERLRSWYQANRTKGDANRALAMLERDLARIDDIRRIDEYLERLDDEIHRANRRAIAYLDYRMRSLRPIDNLVKTAIDKLLLQQRAVSAAPFGAGPLLGPSVLAEPRIAAPRAAPQPLRKDTVSVEQTAKSVLRERAREARIVTPQKVSVFLERELQGRESAPANQFTVSSVGDFRVLQVLLASAAANTSGNRALIGNSLRMTPGRLARFSGTDEVSGTYLSSVPVEIVARPQAKKESR